MRLTTCRPNVGTMHARPNLRRLMRLVSSSWSRWLTGTAGISQFTSFASTTVRINSLYLPTDSSPDDSDFLNSFILDDLVQIRRAASTSKPFGNALRDYLTPEGSEPRNRIDMINEPEEVDRLLGPNGYLRDVGLQIPIIRWRSVSSSR